MHCSTLASLKYIPIYVPSPQQSPASKLTDNQTKTYGVYHTYHEVHRTCAVQIPLHPQLFLHLQTHPGKHLWAISKLYSPQLFHVKWKVLWEPGLCSEILKGSFCLAKAWSTSGMITRSHRTKNQEKRTRIEQDTTRKWWGVKTCLFLEMWLWPRYLKTAVTADGNKY